MDRRYEIWSAGTRYTRYAKAGIALDEIAWIVCGVTAVGLGEAGEQDE